MTSGALKSYVQRQILPNEKAIKVWRSKAVLGENSVERIKRESFQAEVASSLPGNLTHNSDHVSFYLDVIFSCQAIVFSREPPKHH